jgi:periplasmic copper chaperone A
MLKPLITALCLLAAAAAQAQVEVTDAWARATGKGQKVTGVFMNLTAKKATRLVGVKSALTPVTEVHEMKMDKDIMKMQAVKALDLPAGKTVSLKPGSYHVMLMDLKAPLAEGDHAVITLLFEDAAGVKTQQEVHAVAKKGAMGGQHKGKHGEHHHH